MRRAINGSRVVRLLVKSTPAQHAIKTTRAARTLKPAGRVVAGQVRGGTRSYALRDTGATVSIRHRTRDVDILNEIFTAGDYEPPAGLNGHLDGPIRALDLGGNIGLFGAFAFARWQIRELRSFEPDPENLKLLYRTARQYGDQWSVQPVAASVREGVMRFASGRYADSREARPGEAGVEVPMVDVLAGPGCDLLKIDIEGGEWPILADPRLAGFARVIVMEWHGVGRAGEAHRLLADAGYARQWAPPGEPIENGRVWAWRDALTAP